MPPCSVCSLTDSSQNPTIKSGKFSALRNLEAPLLTMMSKLTKSLTRTILSVNTALKFNKTKVAQSLNSRNQWVRRTLFQRHQESSKTRLTAVMHLQPSRPQTFLTNLQPLRQWKSLRRIQRQRKQQDHQLPLTNQPNFTAWSESFNWYTNDLARLIPNWSLTSTKSFSEESTTRLRILAKKCHDLTPLARKWSQRTLVKSLSAIWLKCLKSIQIAQWWSTRCQKSRPMKLQRRTFCGVHAAHPKKSSSHTSIDWLTEFTFS